MPDGASWNDYYAMGAETNGEIVSGIVFENMNGHNANVHIAVSKPPSCFWSFSTTLLFMRFKLVGFEDLQGWWKPIIQKLSTLICILASELRP